MKSKGKVGALKGRPTAEVEGKLREELQEVFDGGRSERWAIKHTNHNKKTIERYWKIFRSTNIFSIDESFIGRQRAAREAALGEIDEDLDKANEEVESALELRDDNQDVKAHALYIKALEHRNFIVRKRAAMDMVPTVDVNIDRIIAEEKNGQSGTGDNSRKDA
jgi:hypothetical protein